MLEKEIKKKKKKIPFTAVIRLRNDLKMKHFLNGTDVINAIVMEPTELFSV